MFSVPGPTKAGAIIRTTADPYRDQALSRQAQLQRRHAWDLDADVPWSWGIDTDRFFLPLDDMAIAFPGASAEQRLALSQWIGLVVNATISEMEDALPKLRQAGWARVLRDYPVSPEMWELGDLFFEEEAKHARVFSRYLNLFCEETGVDRRDLDQMLPKAFGSRFQKAITRDAEAGGHAFWWVVETVEEISIEIFREIDRHRDRIDPLFHAIHKLHLEEEARHANYAILMLKIVGETPPGLGGTWRRKGGYVLSQAAAMPWVVTELSKMFRVKRVKDKHPFFEVLASALPLMRQMPVHELARRVFYAAPYVSWVLNPGFKTGPGKVASKVGAWVPAIRPPDRPKLTADSFGTW